MRKKEDEKEEEEKEEFFFSRWLAVGFCEGKKKKKGYGVGSLFSEQEEKIFATKKRGSFSLFLFSSLLNKKIITSKRKINS